MMLPVCLSYSEDNRREGNAVRAWLEESGWTGVYTKTAWTPDDQGGDRRSDERLVRCEAVVFLVTRSWLADDRCRFAYWLSSSLGKRIFCALVEPLSLDDLPKWVAKRGQIFPLAPSDADDRAVLCGKTEHGDAFEVVLSSKGLDAFKAALGEARLTAHVFAWPPQDEPDRTPYRGLEPLEAADAGIFFGRDAELLEALDRLRSLAQAGPGRFLALIGEGGVGKTSFLSAGLWPRLARDGEHFFPLPVIRPDGGPLFGPKGLSAALSEAARHSGRELSETRIRDAIAGGPESCRDLLADFSRQEAPPTLVLAVDDAEQLLRDDEETGQFLTLLAGLASEDRPAAIVILTIRPGEFGALWRSGPFSRFRPRLFMLPDMSKDAYRAAIEGPLQRLPSPGRWEIEPSLVETLLADLDKTGAAALPLLAFALQALYRLCSDAKLVMAADYQRCGRLQGAIDAAAGRVLAIAGADPDLPRDRDARLSLLRRGLVPWLACSVPGSSTAKRRRARAREIPLDSIPIIELLVEERLATRGVDAVSGEATYELAHDVLLDRWTLLRDWIAAERRLDATLETLQRAARDWDAHGRAHDWAKHAGSELQGAESLYAQPEFLSRLEATDRAYLLACREKEKSLQKSDRLRIPEEERAAKTSAYAQRDAQSVRRLKILAWAGLATTLASVAVAAWLWQSLAKSERQAAARLEESEAALAAAVGSINRSMDGLARKLAGQPESQASLVVDVFNQLNSLQEKLGAYPANAVELRRSQSVALNHISEVRLAKGDIEGARAAAGRSVALMQALSESRPADDGWRRDLSVSYEKLGDAQAASGDLAGARKSYADDLAIAKKLLSAAPENPQRRWDMSVSYEKLGDVQLAQGDVDGALESYGNDRAIREALTAANPENEAWRRGLAVSYEKLGVTLAKRREVPQAIAAFEGALEIYRTLAHANPGDAQTAAYAVVPHWWLADLDKAKTREHLAAALAILQPLADSGHLSEDKRKWMTQIKATMAALEPPLPARR
jgi:tetratricopeptide (TPR) repeat protein